MDKTTLFNTIQSEYTRLNALIAPLSERQLCAPRFDEGWSVKDIMAHTAAWEQICSRWLDEAVRGVTPQPLEELDRKSNERIYQEYRDFSLEEVQEFFQRAHQQFLTCVARLAQAFSEEDLNMSHRFAWTDAWSGSSLLAVIADNSYEHYQDHSQQIRQRLETLSGEEEHGA
ncbi:MAG TPA: ClbS/DfsB family four-helix bundle protein [Ktedonobacteraceae bacterium]|nr:ClbS/DfsB family four-helix bundle protein [Ktedonobacteraceae bacterium]